MFDGEEFLSSIVSSFTLQWCTWLSSHSQEDVDQDKIRKFKEHQQLPPKEELMVTIVAYLCVCFVCLCMCVLCVCVCVFCVFVYVCVSVSARHAYFMLVMHVLLTYCKSGNFYC